jgi:competence CoiA-like predicted nuclease
VIRDANMPMSENLMKLYNGSQKLKREKVKWIINKFIPHQSTEPDNMVPALFRKYIKTLRYDTISTMVLLIRTATDQQHGIKVKVVNTPKAWIKDPKQPKSDRTIWLTSFASNTWRDLHYKQLPINQSILSALHYLVRKSAIYLQ